jgi:hypothetical protein
MYHTVVNSGNPRGGCSFDLELRQITGISRTPNPAELGVAVQPLVPILEPLAGRHANLGLCSNCIMTAGAGAVHMKKF